MFFISVSKQREKKLSNKKKIENFHLEKTGLPFALTMKICLTFFFNAAIESSSSRSLSKYSDEEF